MKKISFLLLIVLSFFFVSINSKVYASNNIYILKEAADVGEVDKGTNDTGVNMSTTSAKCGAFGDPTDSSSFAYYLQSAFNIMKFAGVLLAIIMTVKDLFIAIADQKDDSLKKIGSKTIKRVIYAIIIFFLPMIINFAFNLIGLYGTCAIS